MRHAVDYRDKITQIYITVTFNCTVWKQLLWKQSLPALVPARHFIVVWIWSRQPGAKYLQPSWKEMFLQQRDKTVVWKHVDPRHHPVPRLYNNIPLISLRCRIKSPITKSIFAFSVTSEMTPQFYSADKLWNTHNNKLAITHCRRRP